MPKRHKRPTDWRPPFSEHEAWIDELMYGPRWSTWDKCVFVIAGALGVLAVVGLLIVTPNL